MKPGFLSLAGLAFLTSLVAVAYARSGDGKAGVNGPQPIQALAQMTPAAKGTQGWQASGVAPATLAKTVDVALSQLHLTMAGFLFGMQLKGHGMSLGKIEVRDSKHFLAEFPSVTTGVRPSLTKDAYIANGKMVAYSEYVSGKVVHESFAKMSGDGYVDVHQWGTDFPRAILSGITGSMPVEHLVAQAQRAGYSVSTEQRSIKKTHRVQYRLLIVKPGVNPKKPLPEQYEIIVDSDRRLPLTIRTDWEPAGGKPMRLMWTADWMRATDPSRLPDKDFLVPAENKGIR